MAFSTDVRALDNIIEGGIPENRISGVFAFPNLGKSLLCNQIAMKAASEGKKCLFLLTPSEFDSNRIVNIFKDRYTVDKRNLTFLKIISGEAFASLFNLNLIVNNSTNKTSITIREKEKWRKGERSFDWHTNNFQDYDLVIVDSFSELIKMTLVLDIQNFGARSAIETHLFSAMSRMIEDYHTTFLLVHHTSKNPMARVDTQNPFGGAVLMYLSKYLLLMKAASKKLYDKYGYMARRIQRYRWTGLVKSEFVPLLIKENWGFIDVEDNDIDDINDEEDIIGV